MRVLDGVTGKPLTYKVLWMSQGSKTSDWISVHPSTTNSTGLGEQDFLCILFLTYGVELLDPPICLNELGGNYQLSTQSNSQSCTCQYLSQQSPL